MKKEQSASYLSKEYRNSLGRLLDLSDDELDKLKKRVHKEISSWKSSTSGLHSKLKRWNDLVEGVVEETNYPFDGCSNVHIPIIAIYMKVYHSIFRRSILGSETIWYAESDDDSVQDELPNIENYLNYKAMNKWNIAESISDVLWVTPRDGLGCLEISYVEEYDKNVQDHIQVSTEQEFLEEFPIDDKQMDDATWEDFRKKVISEATEENPIEIPIIYDRLLYKGSKAEVIELANLVTFPATAQNISAEHCKGYGKRFYMRRGEVKKMKREGFWYKDSCSRFLQKTRKGNQVTSYMSSKDYIEGLNRSDGGEDYEFFKVTYRYEFDSQEGEKKILLIYSFETKELMYAVDYPYRVDNYAFFRTEKRPNRLIGNSLVKDVEDLNETVDTLYNQRINSRMISEVPSFKAKKNAKKDFDPEAEENQWRPGVIFWLDDIDAFQQFTVQPVNLESSMAEEANVMNITGLLAGTDPALFSGRAPKDDPKAPGNKTGLLIQQSNMRMDDPLSELRLGVEEVGKICLSMEYQFGDPQIEYSTKENNKRVKKSFPKRLLRKNISVKMHGVNVVVNPDAEFKKWYSYYKFLAVDPMIGQKVKSRWYLLMNAMRSGRIRDYEKILPPLEQLEQEEQQAKQMMEQQKQKLMQEAMAKQQEKANNKKEKDGIERAHIKSKVTDLKLKSAEQKIESKRVLAKALVSQ